MKAADSILKHPRWKELAPFFVIQPYRREGGNKNPRFRIQVPNIPGKTADEIVVRCVACGEPIKPIRPIGKGKSFYYASTCPLSWNIGCSRSAKASEEYKAIAKALESKWTSPS